MFTVSKLYLFCLSLGLVLNFSKADTSSKPLWKDADPRLSFVYDNTVSDEFNTATIDNLKWSENGLENGNTGCPKWNGPVDWDQPIYSTYFKTKNAGGAKTWRMKNGYLQMRVRTQSLNWFKKKEYYCNPKKFYCNHDTSIDCRGRGYDGR